MIFFLYSLSGTVDESALQFPLQDQDCQSTPHFDEQYEPAQNGVYSPPKFPLQDQDNQSVQQGKGILN